MGFFKRKKDKYDLSDVLDENDLSTQFGDLQEALNDSNRVVKPSHALTPEEIAHLEAPSEQVFSQTGHSAADALRSRMQHQPAEQPPIQKPTPQKDEPSPEIERLIAKLHSMVEDIGDSEDTQQSVSAETSLDINAIISSVEQRAEQRVKAAHSANPAPAEKPSAPQPKPQQQPVMQQPIVGQPIVQQPIVQQPIVQQPVTQKAPPQKVPEPQKAPASQEVAASQDFFSYTDKSRKEDIFSQKAPVNPVPPVEKAPVDRAPSLNTEPPAGKKESHAAVDLGHYGFNKTLADWLNQPAETGSAASKPAAESAESKPAQSAVEQTAPKPAQSTVEQTEAKPAQNPFPQTEVKPVQNTTAQTGTKLFKSIVEQPIQNATQQIDIKSEVQNLMDTANVPPTPKGAEARTMQIDLQSSGEITPVEPDLNGTRVYGTLQDDEEFSADRLFKNMDGMLDEAEQQEPDYPDDYTCIDDAPEQKLSLIKGIKKLGVRTGILALCAVLLLLLSGAFFITLPLSGLTLQIVRLVILLVVMLAGSNILGGIISIFKGVSDVDSVAALAMILTLAHNIYFGFIAMKTPVLQPEAIIAVSLVLFNLGKLMNLRRIYKNFCRIATTDKKRAVEFIEKEADVNKIVRGAVEGPALICTGRPTVNVKGFFKNTYSRDAQTASSARLLIVAVVAAVLMGVLGFIKVDPAFAFTAVTVTLSLFAAPATVLVNVLPLSTAADSLGDYDAVLPGYGSALKISRANVLAVDVDELFPKGSVKLYNMRTLSKNPVDKSLCEAAAVVMAVNSPLSDIFTQITASIKGGLPAVDSTLYEDRLGLSGWVNNRRILIGNRTLMENHNVPIPSYELDKKILAKGYFPVYIAADSKPCVLLVVGYHADDVVTYELRRVCNAGYTVMVNSCDPNVSSEMLCDYFGLQDGSIKTMNADGVRTFKQQTEYEESVEGTACYGNTACGLFALATASMRVPALSKIMMVLNILSIAVGVGALVATTLLGSIEILTPLLTLIYQLISTLVITMAPMLFKP